MPAAPLPGSNATADGIRRGDREAFAAVLREHGGELLATARDFVGSDHEPEAVVRKACVIAQSAGDQMPADMPPELWLRRLTIGVALEALKATDHAYEEAIEDLVPRFLPDGSHAESFAPWPTTAAQDAAREPVAGEIRTAISHMPAAFRIVMLLHEVERVSVEDISAILGVPVNGIILQLHRSRLAARTLLRPILTGSEP